MRRTTHPARPYLPNLASPDFYLFGYVNSCLRGQRFEAADELFSSIEAFLRGIEKAPLSAVFLEWMEKLQQCNATNGDYFEDT
jgi:hypothetical protein